MHATKTVPLGHTDIPPKDVKFDLFATNPRTVNTCPTSLCDMYYASITNKNTHTSTHKNKLYEINIPSFPVISVRFISFQVCFLSP